MDDAKLALEFLSELDCLFSEDSFEELKALLDRVREDERGRVEEPRWISCTERLPEPHERDEKGYVWWWWPELSKPHSRMWCRFGGNPKSVAPDPPSNERFAKYLWCAKQEQKAPKPPAAIRARYVD